MIDFIINEPGHKRWWLPDRKHQYNSWIYGDKLHISVIRAADHETVVSVPPIDMNDPQWQDLADTAQALAEKRFKAQTRQQKQTSEYFRSYRK